MSNWVIKKFKVSGKKTDMADETKTERNFYLYPWLSPITTSRLSSAHMANTFSSPYN